MVAVLQRQTSLSRRSFRGVLALEVEQLPMRWRCAACVPCRKSGGCQKRNRLIISMLSVSLFWGGILESSCVEYWRPFIKLGRRQRKCAELEVPLEAAVRSGAAIHADDREANKAWCVDRQELFLYLTSQLLQDRYSWTDWLGLQESNVCTLLLTKSIWVCLTGYGLGTEGLETFVLRACSPWSNTSGFLDSGVRRCCKVGHSCMRRVIGCSSALTDDEMHSVVLLMPDYTEWRGKGGEREGAPPAQGGREMLGKAEAMGTASTRWWTTPVGNRDRFALSDSVNRQSGYHSFCSTRLLHTRAHCAENSRYLRVVSCCGSSSSSSLYVDEVPQIQFIDRVLAFSCTTETGFHSANCAENRRETTGACADLGSGWDSGGEGLFAAFCGIFRTPLHGVESWSSGEFFSPRWPTVLGRRGLRGCRSRRAHYFQCPKRWSTSGTLFQFWCARAIDLSKCEAAMFSVFSCDGSFLANTAWPHLAPYSSVHPMKPRIRIRRSLRTRRA